MRAIRGEAAANLQLATRLTSFLRGLAVVSQALLTELCHHVRVEGRQRGR